MKKVIDLIRQGALAGVVSLTVAGTALADPFDTGEVSRLEIFGGDLEDLITKIVNVILVVVGIVAVLYLIYGGITYVTAGGDAEKAGKGRTTITNAIIGIVIIAASLAIYNYVVKGVSGY